jgi:Trk K+ transport system NAD-binding subunit
MEQQVRFKDQVRYWIDNTFSRGPIALVAWLGAFSVLIVVLAALIISVGQVRQADATDGLTFGEAAWEALMRTLDAGTMGGDTGWGFRLVMFLVTLGGIFIISTLIGVLTTGVESKMEELRKGRSRVIESNHTVILGWSDQIFTILNELVLANSNHKGSCIVVFGSQDKVEMEDAIAERVNQRGVPNKTRIVCRTGSSIDANDLSITNLNLARAIVVLSPEDSEDPDAEVIKTILAILNSPSRKQAPYHIVAELREPRNFEIAKVVGRNEVEWVLVGDMIARVIAQTCRQSGLSAVYTDLLDFGGVEIYFSEQPNLVGLTFGEALLRFDSNTILGIYEKGELPKLNPPMDQVLKAGDQLILLAEDDDKITQAGANPAMVQANQIVAEKVEPDLPERTLILGWNWRGSTIVRELDNYVMPGSEIKLVASVENFAERVQEELGQITLKNLKLDVVEADTTDRHVLESVDMGIYDHVIVLAYLETLGVQQADSRTLITLLHIREMMDRNHWDFSLTSEILDVRNRQLADVTRADDFIVSDRLISLMISQVSENKELNPVLADLFDPEGSEVYLKPAENYVQLGTPVNFYTVVESARRKGEVAMGWRSLSKAQNAEEAYGVLLSPIKSQEVSFEKGDRVIVLAED